MGSATPPRRARWKLASVPLALLLGIVGLELGLGAWASRAQGDHREGPPARNDGPTVLCLGDSHTFGLHVQAEEAWPARLEDELDGTALVVNAGVSGLGSDATAARAPELFERHEPDLVLLSVGANDPERWREGGGRRWWDATRLAHLLRQASPPPSEGVGDVSRLRANVRRVADACAARGVDLVLVGYGADVAQFARTNRALRRVAEDLALPLVELVGPVGAVAEREGRAAVFFPDQHPRPLAHEAAARAVHAALLEVGPGFDLDVSAQTAEAGARGL